MPEAPTYYSNTWDDTSPDGSTVDFGDVDDAIRDLKKDIRERFAVLLPVGAIIKWPSDIIPTGFIELNGDSLNKADYPDLYSYLLDGGAGGIYGEDTETFTLPDYRGKFIRGWDHGAGIDPNASTRSDRGDTTSGDHAGTVEEHDIGAHLHRYGNGYADDDGEFNPYGLTGLWLYLLTEDAYYGYIPSENAGGIETRPKNKYLRYIIKAFDCIKEATIDSTKIFDFIRDWNEAIPSADDLGGRGYRELQFLKSDIITRFNLSFPVGMVAFWPSDTIPYLWAECNGQAISRSTYSDLFNEIEDFFGPGDGNTTYQLPDLRGLFIRANDTPVISSSAGVDPDEDERTDRGDGVGDKYVGSYQDSLFLEHNHDLYQAIDDDDYTFLSSFRGAYGGIAPSLRSTRETNYTDEPDEYGVIQGVNKETRPINKTLRVIMRVLPI